MTDMPVSLPVPGSPEERIAMINDLLGEQGPRADEQHHKRICHRLLGYQAALTEGTRCGSPAVDGGCARYPAHGGGHCTYPLPGDPGYDASPAALAMVRMVDEARMVVEQLTGEPPQDVAEPIDPGSPLYHSLYRQRWKVGPDGRRIKADHTVADIEPGTGWEGVGWEGCRLTTLDGKPLIRLTDAYDVDPAGARQLAAELLSAAARAEHKPMLNSPSEANPVD